MKSTPLVMVLLAACASTPTQKTENAPAANPALLPRCQAVFDSMRPGLEKQWEANVPMDTFQKLREKMPELKQVFTRECAASLRAEDLACAEGDNSQALEECRSQPAEFQQPCRDEAEANRRNPLFCKSVAGLLERSGQSWMKAQGLDQ